MLVDERVFLECVRLHAADRLKECGHIKVDKRWAIFAVEAAARRAICLLKRWQVFLKRGNEFVIAKFILEKTTKKRTFILAATIALKPTRSPFIKPACVA